MRGIGLMVGALLAGGAGAGAQEGPPLESVRAARAAVRHERTPEEAGVVRHRFTFPDGAVAEFRDQPKRPRDQAQRERIVFHIGSQAASREPASTFEAAGRAAGLAPEVITALRFVSQHEGGFDAINTWDRARFSWGFIQFAGGYGFPPALAHVKAASPARFQALFGAYGVDVTPGPPVEPLFRHPESGALLRGAAAEQAYGDDPLVIALFIRAGQEPDMKQRQVEAAIRDYVQPALAASLEGVRFAEAFRSPQALAMLIDRQVHDGNVSRVEWATEHALSLHGRPGPGAWPSLEAQVLDLVVQDAAARAAIVEQAEKAATLLERPEPTGAEMEDARLAVAMAEWEAFAGMTTSYRRDELFAAFGRLRTALGTGAAPPAPARAAAAAELRAQVARFRFEYAVRNRLRNIRTSSLPGPTR